MYVCLGSRGREGAVLSLSHTFANWLTFLVRTEWSFSSCPSLQGHFQFCIWRYRIYVSYQISVSAHYNQHLHYAPHCSSRPCHGRLPTLVPGTATNSWTTISPSPPQITLPPPHWRGGVRRLHFLHRLNPQVLIASLS